MSVTAPLRVPVELRRAGGHRLFRMAHGISERGVEFAVPVPASFDGPLEFTLLLPGDPLPLQGRGEVLAVPPEDPDAGEPERRALQFIGLEETARARVARYVQERLDIQ